MRLGNIIGGFSRALKSCWNGVRPRTIGRRLALLWANIRVIRWAHVVEVVGWILTVCWNILRSHSVFQGLARSRHTIEEAGWSHHAIQIIARCGIALKWMTVSLGVLIACFIGTLFVIDVESYRSLIQSQSEAVLGRTLSIDGDIELDLSLSPTLAVHDVALANVEGGTRPEMARIGTLAIGVELLPLLRGDLRITHLTVIDADLILERGGNNVGNWVLSSDVGAEEGEIGTMPLLQTLVLRNSRLTYVGLLNQRRVVEVDEASLSADSKESEIAVDIAGAVQGVKVSASGRVGSVASLFARSAEWPVDIAGRLGTNRISIDGTIGDPWSFSGFQVRVEATVASLSALQVIGGHGGAVDAIPDHPIIGASAMLSGTQDSIAVTALNITMGDSDLSGAVRISVGANHPTVVGELSSDTIALDELMAALSDEDDQPTELPIELIQAADFDLELSVARLVAEPMEIREIAGELRVQNGQLNLDVGKAVAWGGWWGGRVVADSHLSPLAVGVDITVGQLDLQAMLGHWGVEDAIIGHLDGALTLHGRGDSVEALLDTANGQIALDIGPGQINAAYTEIVGRSVLTALLPDGSGPTTHVNCAVGHFDVAQGVARSSALLVDTERVTVGGEGAVDFGGERLDFLLNPRTKDVNLLALVAPARVHGPFDDVEVSLMTTDLVVDAATSVLLGVVNPFAIVIPFVTTGTGGENPCLTAIVSQDIMTPKSAPERMIGGAVSVVEGFAEGVGDAAEDIGTGISNVIDGIFGQSPPE